ncbi:MAG TPA: type IV pilin protein [Gammaproteobacteria bacterium]|nr:type IV pilin protein [Gammaproteobacteria bacterium]
MNAMHARSYGRGDRRSMRGVTLIELMIVVVVIGILTAIAYPSYRGQMLRTHRAEAKATLVETAQQLERCYTRFNAYNAVGCAVATTLGGAGVNSTGNNYVVTAAPTASAFTLTATPQGAQANDTTCANLTLTQTGLRGATGTAPTTCW